MSERKLVTIRKIKDLLPIPGADRIEIAQIDGWKVVAKKGEFAVGDPCVYFEIDSFLPESDARYSFLMKSGVREFEGQRGHRLRTVKLRGQISQGLALPVTAFPEIVHTLGFKTTIAPKTAIEFQQLHGLDLQHEITHLVAMNIAQLADTIDADFSELLGIKKWEPQLPAELAGQVKGYFPSWMRRTDQERCQNLVEEIFTENANARYEVSLKLDGTSVTFYHRNGEVGVCSRNLELKINEANAGNALVRMLIDSGLAAALTSIGHNIAIQGELMAPGIQNNREGLKTPRFYIFDVQALDAGIYLTSGERSGLYNTLLNHGVNPYMVEHVPVLHDQVTLAELGISNVDELLQFAVGPSINNPVREGLVFKRVDGQFSFKAISNVYLDEEE